MKRRLLASLAAVVVAGSGVLALFNHRASEEIERPVTADTLATAERRALSEARRLKASYGSRVWPGLARADLPQVVYNDRWEFLAGWSGRAPDRWEPSPSAELFEVPVRRRRASDPSPFAVRIGDRWAGRYPVRRLLDRRRLREARARMDPLSALLVPPGLSTVPPDLYVVQLLHTSFHAFQAARSEDRFYRAVELRAAADRYPFGAGTISRLWTREGEALGQVLSAEERSGACRAVADFREHRERRHGRALLDSTLVAYERSQEWLQGLAKYAEFAFYRRAAAGAGAPEGFPYREGRAHWEDDLERLRRELGRVGPDRRFALSGLGQALALERLSPDWKPAALPGGRTLDDLLVGACRAGTDDGAGEGGAPAGEEAPDTG